MKVEVDIDDKILEFIDDCVFFSSRSETRGSIISDIIHRWIKHINQEVRKPI